MQYSFSFCGVDVKDIGLHYVPENADTYVYKPSSFSLAEQESEAWDGGHFYGTTLKPKPFVLRCYYEDTAVDNGFMSMVHSLFKRGKSGKLVFSHRPWLYYTATVTSIDISRMLNLENGLITVQMKAYYPLALTDETTITSNDMLDNSALFEEDITPPTSYSGITSQQTILLYNAGTERASVKIGIAGNVGSGVSLYNRITGQECDFVGLNAGSTAHHVVCDGRTGNVYWSDTKQNAFIYHKRGFIELEPAYPIDRSLVVSANGTQLTATYGTFNESMIGKYIYLDGEFRKIVNVVSETEATVNVNLPELSDVNSPVVTMNEIVVSAEDSMNLSLLEFTYKHTFA